MSVFCTAEVAIAGAAAVEELSGRTLPPYSSASFSVCSEAPSPGQPRSEDAERAKDAAEAGAPFVALFSAASARFRCSFSADKLVSLLGGQNSSIFKRKM